MGRGLHMKWISQKRRGVAATLAMIYLVLISTLAVGFYAATNVAIQAAANDQRIIRATLAAEGGLDFLTYHLNEIVLPQVADPELLLEDIADELRHQLHRTPNFQGCIIENEADHTRVFRSQSFPPLTPIR